MLTIPQEAERTFGALEPVQILAITRNWRRPLRTPVAAQPVHCDRAHPEPECAGAPGVVESGELARDHCAHFLRKIVHIGGRDILTFEPAPDEQRVQIEESSPRRIVGTPAEAFEKTHGCRVHRGPSQKRGALFPLGAEAQYNGHAARLTRKVEPGFSNRTSATHKTGERVSRQGDVGF